MRAAHSPIRPLFLLFLLPIFSACYYSGGPIPEDPVPPTPREPIPQRVIVEEELLYSPAPRENGVPPEACDWIRFVRYRPETPDGEPVEVDAVLVFLPGTMEASNGFSLLGRQLVSMAEAGGMGRVEVWAFDRRANCLEDLTGMNAAEQAGEVPDPYLAIDYYFGDGTIDGRQFEGFLESDDLPFLSEFGLELIMEDVYNFITAKIPDPEARESTIFVGGHSMGTCLAALFAGWDFDGDPATLEDAGFRNLAGLVFLDGRVYYDDLMEFNNIDKHSYQDRVCKIRSGEDSRMSYFIGVNPEVMALLEIFGLNAVSDPDGEALILLEIPLSRHVKGVLRLLTSRDFHHFITGYPAATDFRVTNEAALGVFFDDNFEPVQLLQAGMGFLHGGTVVKKTFPGYLPDLIGLEGVDKDGLFCAWDAGPLLSPGTGPLYTWVNFDEVGDFEDPDFMDLTGRLTYTTMMDENTDIQDFARILYQGPANFVEWYFPARIRLDMGAAASPFNAEVGLNFFHNALVDVPIIGFGGSRGDTPYEWSWDPYLADIASTEFEAHIAEGYTHMDIVSAAVDRPRRRENEVFGRLLDFVFEHSTGSVLVP